MSFLGGRRGQLGFGPSADVMRPKTAMQRNLFIHEAYGPRIYAGTEFFAIVPMDENDNVLSSMVLAEGTEKDVEFDYYDIQNAMKQAGPRATKFFMSHNHPSDSPMPSKEDEEMTWVIMDSLIAWGKARWDLVDHVITTGKRGMAPGYPRGFPLFSSMSAIFPEKFEEYRLKAEKRREEVSRKRS